MKNIPITVDVLSVTPDELSPADRELVAAARAMTYKSYAPYSHFSVGAAIRLADGTVVTGSNQENAAYPSGTCAERTAAFYAHAQHPGVAFEAIAIAARGTDGAETPVPTAPCGACRQVLLEYEVLSGRDVKVILAGRDAIYILPSVRSTLPLAFAEFR